MTMTPVLPSVWQGEQANESSLDGLIGIAKVYFDPPQTVERNSILFLNNF